MAKKNYLIGRSAFINDIHLSSGETGLVRIVAFSVKGPEWVIVEYQREDHRHFVGDVMVIPLNYLSVR
jgi:hypothetical protein